VYNKKHDLRIGIQLFTFLKKYTPNQNLALQVLEVPNFFYNHQCA